MSRKKTLSGKKKIAMLVGAAVVVGGTAVVMTGTSNASVACDGLDTALKNNEKFIADQRANPDAQSEARIANRQAVIEEIKRKQAASGCEAGGGGDEATQPPAGNQAGNQGGNQAGGQGGNQAGGQNGGGQANGEVVCAGSTVTLSGEAGAPAASSNQFPIGTTLKVTNLDNNKSTTVKVTSTSGSCALLNNAAFEQVREPGKNLIRKARIEKIGNGNQGGNQNGNQNGGGQGAGQGAGQGGNQAGNQNGGGQGGGQAGNQGGNQGGDQNGGGQAAGQVVCAGSTVTLSGEAGAPAASSGQFPIGTTLKVTNLDNNKSTTVKVASTSGSCALLNNAAFEQVREPGKFLIRKARIEKIG